MPLPTFRCCHNPRDSVDNFAHYKSIDNRLSMIHSMLFDHAPACTSTARKVMTTDGFIIQLDGGIILPENDLKEE